MHWIALSFQQHSTLQETTSPLDADCLYKLAARYSPVVCWREDRHQPHAGWLVEVQGSFRLFGGATSLLSQVWEQAEPFLGGLTLASHSTATGAWWLSKATPARSCAEFLDMLDWPEERLLDLPVGVLDCDPKLQATWEQCGFTRLFHLRELPRTGFLKRFNAHSLAELDSGFGTRGKLEPGLLAHVPADVFQEKRELPFHSSQLNLIEYHASELLARVCEWLNQQKRGTRELLWTFQLARSEEVLQLRSAHPSACLANWKRLLHHQLARTQWPDEVRSLQLRCTQTELLPDVTASFLPDPAQGSLDWDQTCDVLRARLGAQTILFMRSENDPRPECSLVLQHTPPTGKQAAPPGQSGLPEHEPARLAASTPRPLWLLPEPRPLKGKEPGWFTGGPWQLLSGPERIEFGWWDGQPCKRDYYCARDSNSSVVWIYRDLLNENSAWFLHGYFA